MSNCNNCTSETSCEREEDTCMMKHNSMNSIKKVIGVMSGKGGVGKSSITVLLAKQLAKLGYKVGILDADITGPSIPRLLGLKDKRALVMGDFILPVETKDFIKVISLNFLKEEEDQPVVWRGPVVSGLVKEFWNNVLWETLDYLIIDMPPGTGDVALTVMQSIPLNGIIMVSVSQDLVSMIVSKAVHMARNMNINVLGVIENMSYISCPDCDKKIKFFSGEGTDRFLKDMNLKLLGELPMLSNIAGLSYNSCGVIDENIELIFKPIVTNIVDAMRELKKVI